MYHRVVARKKTKNCNVDTASNNKTTIYTDGCVEAGKKFAKDNLWLIGGVGVGIAVVELLGIGFALCLCVSFRKDEGNTV